MSGRDKTRTGAGRGGQALVGVVISLTFLFGVMGLCIDLGRAYYLKARVQTAADAAASAAAVYASLHGDSCSGGGAVSCGVSYACAGVFPPTNSLQAGCLYTTVNGPSSITATMLENNTAPPNTSGTILSMWIQATVSTAASSLFLPGSGFSSATIAASAIAGVTSIAPGACIYVLSPTANPALTVSGTSTLTTGNCGIYVKSSGAAALTVTGSAIVTATGGGKIVLSGANNYSKGFSTTISPVPIAGTVTDPLSSLTAPSFSATCDGTHTNYSLGNSNVATINPGVYCGGIAVTGAARLTMNPGTYILDGGGMRVQNSAIISGAGVTIYNTATTGYTAGAISMTGAVVVNLSAPTSGTYKGILFYQDRNITYAATNTFANSASGSMTGTYYFPTTAVSYTGAVAAATYQAFVCSTLAITGSSSLTNDTLGTFTGLASSSAALIQ